MLRRALVVMATSSAILMLLAPPVHAQMSPPYVRFEGDSLDGPLMPESDVGVFHLKLTVGCSPSDYQVQKSTDVSYAAVDYPKTVAMAVMVPTHDSFEFGPQACAASNFTHTFQTTVTVSFNRSAPAFAMQSFGIDATVSKPGVNGPNQPYGPYRVQLHAVPDFVPLTQVTPATYFLKTTPNSNVTFPFDVSNLGNGPARVKLSVTQPNHEKLESITVPSDLHLETRVTNGPSARYRGTTQIKVDAPHVTGYINKIYSFQTTFATIYDGAGATRAKTDETSVTLSLQVQGSSGGALGDVPGASGGWLVGLLALTALGLSRRRHA